MINKGMNRLQDAMMKSSPAGAVKKSSRKSPSKSQKKQRNVSGWNKFYEAFSVSDAGQALNGIEGLTGLQKRTLKIQEAANLWGEMPDEGTGDGAKAHWNNLAKIENCKLHVVVLDYLIDSKIVVDVLFDSICGEGASRRGI
jgi:hypothetical protein